MVTAGKDVTLSFYNSDTGEYEKLVDTREEREVMQRIARRISIIRRQKRCRRLRKRSNRNV